MLAYLSIVWNKIRRCKKFVATILVMNVIVLIMVGYLVREGLYLLNGLERKIGVFEYYYRQQIVEILEGNQKWIGLLINNDRNQIDIIENINENIEKLINISRVFEDKLKELKTIDIKNINDVKQANVHVINITRFYQGSGSHIKIDGKSYVLTCAHLTVEDSDCMRIKENGTYYFLELVKIDRENDLALFRAPYGLDNLPYFEFSDEQLKEGSEIIVIGNPGFLEDVFTDGVVAKVEDKVILITNTINPGNSGGAVLYKGKIVGIIRQMLFNFVGNSYGIAINLETISKFLKGIN